MKTEPTKGPWIVTDEGSQIVIQTFEEHPTGTLARMYGTDALARADAHLMALAPELLGALKKLWAYVEDLRKSNPGYLGKLVLQDYAQMNVAFIETARALTKAQKTLLTLSAIPANARKTP